MHIGGECNPVSTFPVASLASSSLLSEEVGLSVIFLSEVECGCQEGGHIQDSGVGLEEHVNTLCICQPIHTCHMADSG